MSIQEILNNCCEALRNGASTVAQGVSTSAQWMGRTVSNAGQYMLDGAQKASEYARPYFEQVMEFAKENQTSLLIGAGCAVLGAIVYGIFSRTCCNDGSQNAPPQTQPQTQTV